MKYETNFLVFFNLWNIDNKAKNEQKFLQYLIVCSDQRRNIRRLPYAIVGVILQGHSRQLTMILYY